MEEKKSSELLVKIIRYFPFFYVCIILYGYINTATFFYIIDVDITKFTTIGELLFPSILSIDKLLFLALIVTFSALYGLFDDDIYTKKDINKNVPEIPKLPKLVNEIIKIFARIFPLILAIAIFSANFFILNSGVFQNITWLYGVALIGFLILFHSKLKRRQVYFLFGILIAYLLLCIIYYQMIRGNAILKGSPEQKINFTYNDISVQSTDSLIYYGKTNSHIFMRDLMKEKTIAYNLEFVPFIAFKGIPKKEYGFLSSLKRDMTNHPIYSSVNFNTELNENVLEVKRLNDYLIINNKYILAKTMTIDIKSKEIKPSWLKNQNLLYNIDPPFKIIKDKYSFSGLIVKSNDTLVISN